MEKDNLKNFTYTTHTGCKGTKENSLESIDVGVQYGAQIVEIDVQYYNGVPVLSHNEPKGDEVTLEEGFLKIKEYDDLKVNVDIKSVENIGAVKEIAEKTNVMDRIFFTGITDEFVSAVKEKCPDIEYYLNVSVLPPRKQTDEYLNSLVEKVKNSGAVGINFNKKSATKKLVKVFRNNGLLVSIWTVNGYFKIRKILSYGPDNITTRRPDKMKKALK
ncbi:MAG: glycerophosphodiester phosphodiesterase [Ruminococcaceae bacterium]|nr:glycerophosphodiester phosphodiesterase [Oscillospiraceae bacterium]